MRFNEYDLYVSILRRSYIPPLMDMYQDIVICSKFCFTLNSNLKTKAILSQRPQQEQENNHNSFKHLQEVHRKIIDSIHPTAIGSQTTIFRVILENRANALLFSEDTLNFYQYNLQVFPTDFLKYAISYLMRIMSTLLNYSAQHYQELSRLIIKTALKTFKIQKQDIDEFFDKKCHEISEMMEKMCNSTSEERYLQMQSEEKRKEEKAEKERLENEKK